MTALGFFLDEPLKESEVYDPTLDQYSQTEMRIENVNAPILKDALFAKFTRLKYLTLNGNQIRYVKSSAFLGLNKLEKLLLTNNSISHLEPNVFEHCPNLKFLDLHGNSISNIESVIEAVASLSNLETLVLDDNPLMSIHERWPPMNSLTFLYFQTCDLRRIVKSAFSSLKNLKVLDLSENHLTEEELENAFTGISETIKDVILQETGNLVKVPTSALEYLSSSEIIRIMLVDYNFTQIRKGDFPFLPTLAILFLSQCFLKNIEIGAFDNLTNLEELVMPWNYFTTLYIPNIETMIRLDLSYNLYYLYTNYSFTIMERQFVNFPQLEVLRMNNMKIGQIPRLAFYGLANLLELCMRNCSLSSLMDYTFQSLTSLEELDLSGNLLIQLTTSGSLYGLNGLLYLFLNNNRLNFDTQFDFGQVAPHLLLLELGRNNLTYVPKLEHLQELQLLFLANNNILPWEQQSLTSNNKLTQMSLDRNSLSTVTAAMIADFQLIPIVNLSLNPFDCNCDLLNFATWLGSDESNRTNVDLSLLRCSTPRELTGEVIDALSSDILCVPEDLTRAIIAGSVTGIFSLILIVTAVAAYYFRWYLKYWWLVLRAKARRANGVNDDKYKYDAFVSYNAHERQWIEHHLVPNIENGEPRLHLCVHERNFEIGKEIVDNIVDSIDASYKVVLVLSNNFVESQWCLWEMNMAQCKLIDDKREALVLVMFEKIEKNKMSSTLRYLIRTRTYIEWPEDNPQGQKLFWERLRQTIQTPEEKVERHQFA